MCHLSEASLEAPVGAAYVPSTASIDALIHATRQQQERDRQPRPTPVATSPQVVHRRYDDTDPEGSISVTGLRNDIAVRVEQPPGVATVVPDVLIGPAQESWALLRRRPGGNRDALTGIQRETRRKLVKHLSVPVWPTEP